MNDLPIARSRRVLLALAALMPPAALLVYQAARELTGALPAPVDWFAPRLAAIALVAAIGVGLPVAATMLGFGAARQGAPRWFGPLLAAAALLLILANIGARAS